jgi:hypothetical protein
VGSVIKEGSFLALKLSSVLSESSATKSECRKDRLVKPPSCF